MAMKPSDLCLALIRQSEGLRLSRYRDAVGNWTIGFGHLLGEDEDLPSMIDEAVAESLLRNDAAEAGRLAESLVSVPLLQQQYDALTDFVFNLGYAALRNSTLLRLLNGGDYAIEGEFYKWCHAGGKVLPGLVTRRAREARMWVTGDWREQGDGA